MTSFRATSEAILRTVRVRYARSARDQKSELLDTSLDWQELLSMALRHGIVPLLQVTFGDALRGMEPVVAAELRKCFQESAANSIRSGMELCRLFRQFHKERIAALSLKGPALALQLYGALSLRTVRDLDILVRDSDFGRALECLYSFGYIPIGPVPTNSIQKSSEKHILLRNQQLGLNVELHWRVANPSFCLDVDFDKLWRKRSSVVMADSLVLVLCPEHLIIFLSIHGASHGWTSLKWICDVAEFLQKYPELNWLHVLAEARALGCFRMLLITVQLAGELAGIPVPALIVSALHSEKSAPAACHNVRSRLFSERPILSGLDRVLFFIRIRERLRDRLRLAVRFVASRLASNERLWDFLFLPARLMRILIARRKSTITPLYRALLDRPC